MKQAKKGFGSMNREKAAFIQRKGGLAVSKNKKHMARIGKIGGTKTSQDRTFIS